MGTRVLLLVALVLTTTAAYADERTWTIATGVFTTKAELVAVRGDVVYLKVGEKIEEYPFNRLSAADQKYIASLSLAPVSRGANNDLPGKAMESGGASNGAAPNTPMVNQSASDILPTPPVPPTPPMQMTGESGERSLLKAGPTLNPPLTEEAIPLPTGPAISSPVGNGGGAAVNQGAAAGNQTRTMRSSNYGSTAPSALSNQTPYRSTGQSLNTLNGGSNNSANARRLSQPQQLTQQQLQAQQQQQRRATAQQNQNQNQNQNEGILGGLRTRRSDRPTGR